MYNIAYLMEIKQCAGQTLPVVFGAHR